MGQSTIVIRNGRNKKGESGDDFDKEPTKKQVKGLDKKVATLDAGQFPDEKLKGGATSITFSSALNGINKDAATIKCYEYVIFNKALNTQELYDIDWYVTNKYNYNKGRAYGGIGDG